MLNSICSCGFESTDDRTSIGTCTPSEVPQHTARCKLGRFAQSHLDLRMQEPLTAAPEEGHFEDVAATLWSSTRPVNGPAKAVTPDAPSLWSHPTIATRPIVSPTLRKVQQAPTTEDYALQRFPRLPDALSEWTTESDSDADSDDTAERQPWEVGTTFLQCHDCKSELRWVMVDEIRPDRHWMHRYPMTCSCKPRGLALERDGPVVVSRGAW